MHDLSAKPTGALTRYPRRLRLLGPAGRYCCRLAAAIEAYAASAAPLDAADIKEGPRLGEVVLEGTIAPGDYDKLLSYVVPSRRRRCP